MLSRVRKTRSTVVTSSLTPTHENGQLASLALYTNNKRLATMLQWLAAFNSPGQNDSLATRLRREPEDEATVRDATNTYKSHKKVF